MRLSFLTLPPDERRLYLDQAAFRRNVSPSLARSHGIAYYS
jgi:hypothetical protein